MTRRTAAVLAALVIAVPTCTGDDDGGSVRADAPAGLELRPVLEVLPPHAPDAEDVLSERDGTEVVTRYRVGPNAVPDARITEARAHLEETQSSWIVLVTFDEDTLARFNQVAEACHDARPLCPRRQLAVVYGGDVLSAPTVEQPGGFGEIAITSDFSEREAKDLAAALDPG